MKTTEQELNTNFIILTKENIGREHICCAFSGKNAAESKKWLESEFDNGFVFRRMDARAKVFIDYVPAEKAWTPVDAPNYLMIGCFWVSGKPYSGKGYAKALLQSAINDVISQGKDGLATVVGVKKFHFMSNTEWLLRQGFEVVDTLPNGFCLIAMKLNSKAPEPVFKDSVRSGECPDKEGIVVYYSKRCPFVEYWINRALYETAENRNLPLKIIKLETYEQAQSAPTPATIFSLFFNGRFVTTDVSVCMDKNFDKIVKKSMERNK